MRPAAAAANRFLARLASPGVFWRAKKRLTRSSRSGRDDAGRIQRSGRPSPLDALVSRWAWAVLAVVAYVPLLLTAPGRINADTKQALYLAPGRLLERAPFLWDPNAGLGTVTHQNIGYLWPMGPFFWVFEQLGAPDWLAQRLWVGTILFAAGAGVLYLLRVLDVRGVAPRAAALLYMLSPYTLGYVTGASVILLPFSALPWLLALTVQAVRVGGWRYPALFALVLTTAGSINGSSLLFAVLAPVLWLPFAVWVTREATWRRAAGAGLRIGALAVPTQLWWLVALAVGGRYGLPLLRATETVEQTSATSSAPEVLRGLGYWFFYGGDNVGQWLGLATPYLQAPWLLAATFAVPVLAFGAAVLLRWRQRAYFVALVLTGTVVAVGAFNPHDPSPLGRAFLEASHRSDLVLSLRNTQRAVPLVALGFAVLIAAALAALGRVIGRRALLASGVVVAVAATALAPLWTGELVADRFHREEIPGYWEEAAAWLDAGDDGTRVLELPGSDFAAYRWGNTLDPITPALVDRRVVWRELVPFGSPASVSLLNALDRRIQEGLMEPGALAPVARLMGAGVVLFRFDLEYERYRTPRPWVLWDQLRPTPQGLGQPVTFGEPVPNRAAPEVPMVDEIYLASVPGQVEPPPVAAFPVRGVPPLVRARALDRPVVLAGDGEGIVEAAAAGLVDGRRPLFYSADLAPDGDAFGSVLDAGAELVLTDTNRRAAARWFTLRENTGYTERAGEEPLEPDETDARLPLFPDAGDDARTVAVSRGGVEVRASAYGNPVSYVPDHRPSLAADGDVETAWIVGGFSEAIGHRIVFDYDRAVTTDHVVLVQPQRGSFNREITEVALSLDGGPPQRVVLGGRSLSPDGHRVDFPTTTLRRLEIEITDTDLGERRSYAGVSGVGFAEVRVDGREVDEVERLPVDLLEAVPDDRDHRLSVVLARRRANPAEPVRDDPEVALRRMFELPHGRAFSLEGTARLSASAPDDVLDRLVGIAPAAQGGITAYSSGRLPGDLSARASAAFDGDRATAWSPGFLGQTGHWIHVVGPAEATVDRLDIEIVADGRHSVPTEVVVRSETGEERRVPLPPVDDRAEPDAVVPVTVEMEPLAATELRFTFTGVRPVHTPDWYSEHSVEMPLGIAEIAVPGWRTPASAPSVETGCRDDLVTVDDRPVPVRVAGATRMALEREGLALEGCEGEVALGPGSHVVSTGLGRELGVDVDRLVLESAAVGGHGPTAGPTGGPAAGPEPELHVASRGRTSVDADVAAGGGEPFWFVLGESHNEGWDAEVEGGALGRRHVVDGYANGWLVRPEGEGRIGVEARWRPQGAVWAGLGASAAAVAACLVLAAVGRRRRAAGAAPVREGPEPRLDPPWAVMRARPPGGWPAAVAAAVLVGAIGAVVAAPWVGAVAAALVFVGARSRRPRAVLGLPAVAAVGTAAAGVVVGQVVRSATSEAAWPMAFEALHPLAMLGVVLLGALVGVERWRDRS